MVAAIASLTASEAKRAAAHALDRQVEEEWLAPVAAAAAREQHDPVLWQWAALLYRALDDRHSALAAYARAVAAAPDDVRILHGFARTRWEAGLPSVDQYMRALALAPFDGEMLLGLAGARVAMGDTEGALDGIRQILHQEPRWIDGQRQAAHLRFLLGDRQSYTQDIERALATHPHDEGLWHLLLTLRQHGHRDDRVLAAARQARAVLGDRPFIAVAVAVHASDKGDVTTADAGFLQLSRINDASIAVHHVRHLIRSGRWGLAAARIEPFLDGPEAAAFVPYAALVWRATDDPRVTWLERHGGLLKTFDLRGSLPPLDRLAHILRTLHRLHGDPLDQSLRGGSQTDGPLFANLDADIQATRAAVVEAVGAYVAELPSVDARHPTLRYRRDARPRFAGSWSVRLRGAGHHSNHVHPQGWISSALYIDVPVHQAGDPPDAGWFTLGEPPSDLGVDLQPYRTIQPQPGKLVLFPSTCWHGTRPVARGERLTIAFDIALPRLG